MNQPEFSEEPVTDEETSALYADPQLREIVERSRESYRKQGGISAAEMRRQVAEWNAEERPAVQAD